MISILLLVRMLCCLMKFCVRIFCWVILRMRFGCGR